ncbi:LLM class flavin-dependent oxidoreductase [Bacillus sp. JCM 19041]
MKLSILDQVPRSSETTNEIALKETADLALAAESLGTTAIGLLNTTI